eukprot:227615-Pelagomonas_calceolata.AAC.3
MEMANVQGYTSTLCVCVGVVYVCLWIGGWGDALQKGWAMLSFSKGSRQTPCEAAGIARKSTESELVQGDGAQERWREADSSPGTQRSGDR